MNSLRTKWRWLLVLAIVVVVILANIFVPVVAINVGLSLLAFFSIIVIAGSAVRKGSGGIEPQHYQSGNTGNS